MYENQTKSIKKKNTAKDKKDLMEIICRMILIVANNVNAGRAIQYCTFDTHNRMFEVAVAITTKYCPKTIIKHHRNVFR